MSRKIIKDTAEKEKVSAEMKAVFAHIVRCMSRKDKPLELDIEMLIVVNDTVLNGTFEVCQYFAAMYRKGANKFDLFCGITPTDADHTVAEYGGFSGKPVRLSHLILEAVNWKNENEYNPIMNCLAKVISQIIPRLASAEIRRCLQRIISHFYPPMHESHQGHDENCVCQQTPHSIVRSVLSFISGVAHETKWDTVLFFKDEEGKVLNCLELFNIFIEHDGYASIELSIEGSGIPYGWSPDEDTEIQPIRLTDLITHACTWTGGNDQQEMIFRHVSHILSTMIEEEEEPEDMYKALQDCYIALHNTRLH